MEVGTGTHLRTLTGHTFDVISIAFSPDGKTLASGSADELRLWDTNTGKHKIHAHADSPGTWGGVLSVAFSPDGSTLASGSLDNTIRLWDTTTGKHKHMLATDRQNRISEIIMSVVFSPDGNTLASGKALIERSGGTIHLWNATTGERKQQALIGHTGSLVCGAFSPDGNIFASGSWEGTIPLWDTTTGEHKHTLRGHTNSVWSVAFSPDGSTLASGSLDNTIRLWELSN